MEKYTKREIITFGNDLNTMSSQGLTSKELNVLMTVCLIAKDRGTDKVRLPLSTLRNLADVNGMSNKDFCDDMEQFDGKISRLVYKNSMTGEYTRLTVFDWFKASKEELYVEIGISPRATYLFNDLNDKFTKMNLKKHNALSLKSSKLLYRNLCQYRNTGYWKIDLENFRRIFGISDNYETRKIKNKIIDPAIEELKGTVNIKCKVLKKRSSTHETEGYEFNFKFLEEKQSNEGTINELVPDTRTEEELAVYNFYKEIVTGMIKDGPFLNEYQINLIANKAIECGRNESQLRECLEYALNKDKTDNFMGVILDIIKNYEKYKKSPNISYQKTKENFENERGSSLTDKEKIRYWELFEKKYAECRPFTKEEESEFAELEEKNNKVNTDN